MIHSTFATLLLMIPVLAIPALAIFGIPQFAPVVVSPLDEGEDEDRESRVGQSARLGQFDEELDDAPAFDSGDARAMPRGYGLGDSVSLDDAPGRSLHTPEFRKAPQSAPAAPRADSFTDPLRPARTFPSRPARPQQGFTDTRSNDWAGERETDLHGSAITTPFQDAGAPNVSLNAVNPEPAPGNNALTWPEAMRRLNELQIRDFRLGRGLNENEFLFVCSYTPTDSPRVSYRFEAESTEPLKAVENVLEQVVAWQQRRR